MRNTFKVLFYIKKNAPHRDGLVPVMARITINGLRTQFSTRLTVDPAAWSVEAGRVAGHTDRARRINARLDEIRFRVEKCYDALFREQMFVTPFLVKEMYFGQHQRHQSVAAFFREHNEEFARMVGVTRSKATYYKYRCVCTHLENYIASRYKRRDLLFRELDRDFLVGFHAYIARECDHKKNTTWIYMIALKHILMLARSRGYLPHDLFANYRLRSEFVERNYLTLDELSILLRLQPEQPSLRRVLDAFLFSCFTGLSYIDLRNLRLREVQKAGKQLWITTRRNKTGSEVSVRLFAVPTAILFKYAPASRDEPIFNLPCNGWCNLCLEKIMGMAGISKHITFHAARHTFATTITLSQGVAIETISKLLGHKNIRTTQIYAAVTRARLDGEMERLSRVIDPLWGDIPHAGLVGSAKSAIHDPLAGTERLETAELVKNT